MSRLCGIVVSHFNEFARVKLRIEEIQKESQFFSLVFTIDLCLLVAHSEHGTTKKKEKKTTTKLFIAQMTTPVIIEEHFILIALMP